MVRGGHHGTQIYLRVREQERVGEALRERDVFFDEARAVGTTGEEEETGESVLEETTRDHLTEETGEAKPTSMNVVGVCPKCGQALMHMEDRVTCLNCGFSRC